MSRYTRATYEVIPNRFNRFGKPMVRLTSRMVYEIDHLGSGWLVVAEAGFECDLTSIPPLPEWFDKFRIGRALVKFRDWVAERLGRAAIVHDRLRNGKCSKFFGDYVFWDAMGDDKVPLWLRIPAFALVLMNFSRS